MGLIDELESEGRRRWPIVALLGLVLVAAAVFVVLRVGEAPKQGPLPESGQAAPAEEEADFSLGGVSGLRPDILDELENLQPRPVESVAFGRRLDERYYYPQKMGLEHLKGTYESAFVEREFQNWLVQNGVAPDVAAQQGLDIAYEWTPTTGHTVELIGWPESVQPLEKKRHTNVVRDLLRLNVPATHAEFFADYDLQVRDNGDGILVSGVARNPHAVLRSFRKLFLREGSLTYIEGIGTASSFEALTRYATHEGSFIINQQLYFVETPGKELRYLVQPIYQRNEGLLVLSRAEQMYVDEKKTPEGPPLAVRARELEVRRENSEGAADAEN